MAFMMKKKKYKFTVELCLEEITAVPFLNGVLFAKIRLLDGGSFIETSNREEVQDHKVKWGAKFEFVCKMSASASTGVLDPCMLRVSVRKELKGGRSFQKLGFTDLNLAEFAGSGFTQRKCLLEGYDMRRRQDNSMLSVTIRMNMLAGDIVFKQPPPTLKPVDRTSDEPESVAAGPEVACPDRRDDFSGGSIASVSSGIGSLTKKKPLFTETPSIEADEGGLTVESFPPPVAPFDDSLDMGHSRNPSNTSQMSKGSGYGSMNSQHSRQSSSGDSGHVRNNGGSCLVETTGSLDRGKIALERRKKAAEEGPGGGRVEYTRVNPNSLIEHLLQETTLNNTDDSSGRGLVLFIAKDGTTALGGQEVKNQMPSGVFKQVVIEEDR
uniref:Protein FAM102A n=1 Tax=Lygus hesperus TaxID=30085 RepID=A0A0A9XTG1_LYGHE